MMNLKLKYLPWVLLVFALAFIIYSQYLKSPAEATAFSKFEKLTEQSGEELFPDISPDGNYITYTKLIDGIKHIFLQRIGGVNAIDLTKKSGVNNYQSVFSPDGQVIVFRSDRDDGGLFLMGSTGESVKRLTDFGYNPAWSPDDKKIIFATESVELPYTRGTVSQLWTVEISNSKTEKIYDGDAVQPSWSPNGKWIAYWGLPIGSGRRAIYIIPATGGTPIEISNDNYIYWSPTWSTDGKYLYFSSSRGGSMNLWRAEIDENSGKATSDLEPVTTPSPFCSMVRMSKDGTKMIFASLDIRDNIYKIEFDPFNEKVKGQPVAVTKGSRQFGYPSISYDNNWIAVNSLRQQEDIYVMRSDGSDISKLTNDLFKDRGPKWTPDGKSLIFYSDRSGKYEIWRIDIDGSNLKMLTFSEGIINNPFNSPDGKSIICQNNNKSVIFHPDSTPTNEYMLLPDLNEKGITFLATSVSPNGNYLAGNSGNITAGRNNGILIYSLIEKKYREISETGRNPEWLNGGKRLFYEDNNKFYLINVETGVSHFVYDPKSVFPTFNCIALSPDNHSIYYVNEEKESDIWMGYLQ